MKRIKIFFTLLASFAMFNMYAQNTFPASGNVGIGISMPETFLHLKANGLPAYPSKASRGNIMQLFQADNNDLEIGIANGLNSRKAWLLARHLSIPDYGQYYSTLHLQPKIDEMGFYRGVAIGYEAYTDVPYGTGLAVEGNVGIGTINPREKLSVNGNIRAREIKVETNNWPDYVFKPNYNLLPLHEAEQFIMTNGHLPDVPKAEEVVSNGLSLGEMNKILLKKIEEITLHVIELDKANKKQQDLIEALQEKIK